MLTPALSEAIGAARDRKARDLRVLDLTDVSSFTDYFLICTGTSTRHTQSICDGIVERLRRSGMAPVHIEGYSQAEWVLVDYLTFVVHIFVERARSFYDLEGLWKSAARVEIPDEGAGVPVERR